MLNVRGVKRAGHCLESLYKDAINNNTVTPAVCFLRHLLHTPPRRLPSPEPKREAIPSRWECVWHELSTVVRYRRLFTPLPHTKRLFSFSFTLPLSLHPLSAFLLLTFSHLFPLSLSLLTLYSTVLSMALHFTTRASCSSTLPGGQLAFFTTHQGYCPGLCVCLCVCRCVFVWSQSHQVYCGGWQCSGPVNQFLL